MVAGNLGLKLNKKFTKVWEYHLKQRRQQRSKGLKSIQGIYVFTYVNNLKIGLSNLYVLSY